MSGVRCHSNYIFFFFFLQNCGASRCRVCYQWGLPRLVFVDQQVFSGFIPDLLFLILFINCKCTLILFLCCKCILVVFLKCKYTLMLFLSCKCIHVIFLSSRCLLVLFLICRCIRALSLTNLRAHLTYLTTPLRN